MPVSIHAASILLALAAGPTPRPAGETGGADGPAPAQAEAAPAGEADADAEEPEKVTQYRFTGLDIEGELRTPALLQFLAKIAGAFETLGIPHRSFMPELEATLEEDVL